MAIRVVQTAPRNPRAALENRRMLDAAGTLCLNLIGGTGSGKTALLEAILPRLRTELRIGLITGDLTQADELERIVAMGVPVVQVPADPQGQIGAHQVQQGLAEPTLRRLNLLIVENGGSLAVQAATDLGEHLRVATLSISAGDRVAAKYPMLFRTAALILFTKYDLLPYVQFDLDGTVRALKRSNPAAEIICTDTRKRVGIDRVAGWLLGYVRAYRLRQAARPRPSEPVWLPT